MPEVIGQEDPAVDVPAVQKAIDASDAGEPVVLRGTFSFEGVNLPGPDDDFGTRVILVSGPVTIQGEDATILGGGVTADGGLQADFLVDALEAQVGIEGLRFVNPNNAAIRIVRSGDLRIEECEIDGITPTPINPTRTGALGIDLRGGPFGAIALRSNRLRIGGTEDDRTGGIAIVVRTGTAGPIQIAENRIEDVAAHGLNVRNVGGSARIEHNVVVTGPVGGSGESGNLVDALDIVGFGEYRVIHNEFDCGARNAAVVRLAATTNAEVRRNEITASLPEAAEPGPESAGVQIRGTAADNEVRENRIRGRGRVAFSVIHSDFGPDRPNGTDGNPVGNTYRANNHQGFASTVATIVIGNGVRDTEITGGSGTLIDEGTGTVVSGNYSPP